MKPAILQSLVLRAFFSGTLAAVPLLSAAPVYGQLTASGAPAFDFTDVVETVSPAVVAIQVSGELPADVEGRGSMFPNVPENHPLRPFFDDLERRYTTPRSSGEQTEPQRQLLGQGSGFFISANGYVVTNYHVVQDASYVVVVTEDGQEYSAEIVGTDPRTDLALLKTDRNDAPFVAFADPEDIQVGQWVIAVGNPFGLGGSVTAGIVSALGRNVNANAYDDFIQIDAPVNRGNSGGPTFDYNGSVIGVNTAIFSPSGGNVGIAFAIPASIASEVVDDLRDDGKVSRGYLGVTLQPVSADIVDALELDSPAGALVAQAQPDGPAAQAGIEDGDIITAVNGKDVVDNRDLARTIAEFDPGDTANITIQRDTETLEIEVRLGELPN